MYIKSGKNKINIFLYEKFSERFKTLKFVLDKIDYGIKLPKKKIASTYFFCQRVDICFTDRDDKILYLYKNVKSEKRIIKFKAFNVYYLPIGTLDHFKVGDKIFLQD